jgi:hypothetical protein
MIWNIIDRRERPFRWKAVNAVVESADRENHRADADQAPSDGPDLGFDSRKNISVADAVAWASAMNYGVILYLYDVTTGV